MEQAINRQINFICELRSSIPQVIKSLHATTKVEEPVKAPYHHQRALSKGDPPIYHQCLEKLLAYILVCKFVIFGIAGPAILSTTFAY